MSVTKPGGLADFHTHILPMMDDGSRSPEEGLQMLRASAASGVDTVVLTPHFYAGRDNPEHFCARLDRSLAMLHEALAGAPELADMRLIHGAEIEYFNGIACVSDIPALKLGDSGCMLVEMPHGKWTSRVVDDVLQLNNCRNTRVVLVHVERYLFDQTPDVIEALLRSGVLMQSNASFFTGRFSSGKAIRMLRRGWIHLLGSDAHNTTTRPPNLAAACDVIRKRAGEELLSEMMWGAKHVLRVGQKTAGGAHEG